MTWLKDRSGPWIGARRFAFVAVVSLARINLRDALRLTAGDVDLENRTIRISRREDLKDFGAAASKVHLCEPLAEILNRWLPRTTTEWVFPNQLREGPWAAESNSSFDPHERLAASCKLAGVRPLVFRDMKEYGEANMMTIAGPGSPFVLGAEDTKCLRTSDLNVGDFYAQVIKFYRPDQTESTRYVRYAFEVLAKMGTRGTSDFQSADFIDRYAAMVGASRPDAMANSRMVAVLHSLYGHGIRLGCFDIDLFAGRPGFRPIGRWRGDEDPPRIHRPRRRKAAIAGDHAPGNAGEDHPTLWRGTRRQLESELAAIGSEAQRDAIRALISKHPVRLTKLKLADESKRGDAYNHLRKLKASGTRLGRAIDFRGRGRRGAGILIEIVE